jgi:cysteine desulfurase/selenocysteine lyase
MVDWTKIRKDFPALERKINGRPVVYLDSACMALKPRQVIDAMNEYYEMYPACAGRSIHRFGEEASNAYSAARGKFAKFLNAAQEEECIWTRNATESLNIVASSVKLPKGSKKNASGLEMLQNLSILLQAQSNYQKVPKSSQRLLNITVVLFHSLRGQKEMV